MEEINSQDILNSIDLNKINQTEKKKRGRPKKTQQMMTPLPKIKFQSGDLNDLEEEEIILHLPISKAELMEINSANYSINDIVDGGIGDAERDDDSDEFQTETNTQSHANDMTNSVSESETSIGGMSNVEQSKHIDNYVKQLGLIIKKLKEENDELKKYLTDITPMYFTEVKVYPIELKLFDREQNKLIPTHTNICCWWCTYPFECLPTFLPEKYFDGNFHVCGCFCSFNCAGAYNMSLADNKIWDRYSLLKLLYYMINRDKVNSINDIDINIAGPKELLNKYGGPMSISEYRKSSKILGREYHKLIPPFLPINFGFEEVTNSKTHSNPNLNNIIYSASKSDGIVIKRNKPVNNVVSKHIDYYVSEK